MLSATSQRLYLKLLNQGAFANEELTPNRLCEESAHDACCLWEFASFLGSETAVKIGSCDHRICPVTKFGCSKSCTGVSCATDTCGSSPEVLLADTGQLIPRGVG